jgi:hypothetical protein
MRHIDLSKRLPLELLTRDELLVMRQLDLSYGAALTLARGSRPEITPNGGFEKQLRIWEFCSFDVYTSSTNGGSRQKEKPAYKAWKIECAELSGEKDVLRARLSSMGATAARFGRMRTEKAGRLEKEGSEDRDDQRKKREEAWERVHKMEQNWNDRLMRGDVADAE